MLYFGIRARMFRIGHFLDPDVKRMLSKLQNIDKSALPMKDLLEVIDRALGLQCTHTLLHPRGGWGRLDLEPEYLRQERVLGGWNQSFL